MSEKSLIPQIRFKNFTDPWEQRKLGEIAEEVVRPVTLEDDRIYQLVTVRRRNEGVAPRSRMSGSQILVKNYQEIRSGDFLISKRQIVHGANGFVPDSLDKAIVSNEYLVLTDSRYISTQFWSLLSKTRSMYRIYYLSSFGVDVEKLVFDVNDWKKRGISIPSKPEQECLITFFSRLDSLITLHQRKYDKLRNVKKAMLEKMFPKNGERFPEIRFVGFTDPWEQRKACEVFGIVDKRGYLGLPVLSATQDQGMVRRDDTGRFISYDKTNESSYKHILPGNFIVHLRSFQGGLAHSPLEGIASPAYTVLAMLQPQEQNERFWKHWFASQRFIRSLATVTYGIRDGRSINVDELMRTSVTFPSVHEQNEIAATLDRLDTLITLHQRKLELLRNIKKALLDKMFPNEGGEC